MSGLVFVDTNVLLYAMEDANQEKEERAREWRIWLWETRRGRVSFQVLQEFYSNICRKWPKAKDFGRLEIEDLLRWKPISVNAALLQSAWRLQDRFGFSSWDSLIVAAAKASSCDFLLTEDFQTGQNVDGLSVVSPFKTQPKHI